jgi:Amt family ammonium transporter
MREQPSGLNYGALAHAHTVYGLPSVTQERRNDMKTPQNLIRAIPLATILISLTASLAIAQGDEAVTAKLAYYAIDNIVLFFCAVFVFLMQPGFALVEAGLNPSKSTVHVMFKNTIDMCFGILLYFLVGYSLMYGADASGGLGLLGWNGFGIMAELNPADIGPGTLHPQVDWLFQVAFAAATATIVGGAVSGRMTLKAYLIYTITITAIVYPISGFWKWGGGWLDQLGFYDFAGSIVVHSVGGFAALAGVMVLGPRIGRFNQDGSANMMPAHSLVLSTLGVFILWIGWYGFNPGSQLAFSGAANTNATMLIAANTTLAAAAGGATALVVGWLIGGRPQLLTTLNGILAGLVGITANCDSVTNLEAIIIGLVAAVLVILGARLLEKLQIDDVVGAWPVHGLCGVWGGIATGIFGGHPLGVQILGSVVIPAWAFLTMFGLFYAMKVAGILRVSHGEELVGLDLAEHDEVEGDIAFSWREEFNLHVPSMDKQHKKLVAVAQDIIESMRSGLGKGAVEEAFQGLLTYTTDHFKSEEIFMAKHEYPRTEEHKAIHKQLTERVLEYSKEFFSKETLDAAGFQRFLTGWLVNHILEEDRQYAVFVNAKK